MDRNNLIIVKVRNFIHKCFERVRAFNELFNADCNSIIDDDDLITGNIQMETIGTLNNSRNTEDRMQDDLLEPLIFYTPKYTDHIKYHVSKPSMTLSQTDLNSSHIKQTKSQQSILEQKTGIDNEFIAKQIKIQYNNKQNISAEEISLFSPKETRLTESQRLIEILPDVLETPPLRSSSTNSSFSDGNADLVTAITDRNVLLTKPLNSKCNSFQSKNDLNDLTDKKLSSEYSCSTASLCVYPELHYRRHSSNETTPVQSNVLRRVSSLILNRSTRESRSSPRLKPRKLDNSLCEKFEGQYLVNWLKSGIKDNLKLQLSDADLKSICIAVCNHLVSSGVLKSHLDKNEFNENSYFEVGNMYYWAQDEMESKMQKNTYILDYIQKLREEINILQKENEHLSMLYKSQTSGQILYKNTAESKSVQTMEDISITPQTYMTLITKSNENVKKEQKSTKMFDENAFVLTNINNSKMKKDTFQTTILLPKTLTTPLVTSTEMSELKESSPFTSSSPLPPPPPPPPPPLPPPIIGLGNHLPAPIPELGNSCSTPSEKRNTPPVPPPMPNAKATFVQQVPEESQLRPIPEVSSATQPMSEESRPSPLMPSLETSELSSSSSSTYNSTNTSISPPLSTLSRPTPLPLPPIDEWNCSNQSALRKKPINPEVPMKPLYWTRIIIPVNEKPLPLSNNQDLLVKIPLWAQIDEDKNLNVKEFADLFSRQVNEKKLNKKQNDLKPHKIQPANILDSKRSKMVGILEKSLHIDFSEIENAVYNMDTSVINLETLKQIYEIRPTSKELDDILAFEKKNPDIPLDSPELFLKKLSSIKHFSERIACLMFQNEFQDTISILSSKFSNLCSTCDYMLNSNALKRVMSLILTVGNYMNGGNRTRGQADGFGLEILGKLKDVKSNVPGLTLLHYIVKTSLNQEYLFEECLPVPEPIDVEAAATINFNDISEELNKLEQGLNTCKSRSKIVTEDNTANAGVFKKTMDNFIKISQKKLINEKERLAEAKRKFISVMAYYQYIPKSSTIENADPRDFFMLWLSFCRDFKDIWKTEQMQLKKERIMSLYKKRGVVIVKKRENGLKARMQRLAQNNF